MILPLVLLLAGPIAGAVVAGAFGDIPAARRVSALLFSGAALAGAAYGLQRAISGAGVDWRGFTMDPWRGVLACGSALAIAVAVARVEESPAAAGRQAAIFAGGAAAFVPLVVPGAHLLAVGLLAGTIGFGVVAFAEARSGESPLRAVRSVAALVCSDILALVALGASLGRGVILPVHPSATAGALLLAAAVIRLGIAPAGGPAADASRASPALGLFWHGPVRAQGFLLGVMALGAGRGVAHAAAAVAALAILTTSAAARRDGVFAFAPFASAIALLGFALGGATATWGATLALAAGFAAWPARYGGRRISPLARASLVAIPAGALLSGAALVLGVVLGTTASRPWYLALALPALAGSAAALSTIWRAAGEGAGDGDEASPPRVSSGIPWIPAALGIAAAAALAAAPARAASGIGIPVAASLGIGPLLSAGGDPGVPEGLAVLILAAGLIAFAAGPGSGRDDAEPAEPSEPAAVARRGGGVAGGRILSWWACAPEARANEAVRRWAMGAAVLAALAAGLAVRVYIVAAGRGFL